MQIKPLWGCSMMEDWTTVSGLFECPIQEWNFEISVTYYIIVTSRIDVVPLRWMNAGLRFHMHTFDFDKQAAFKKINKKKVLNKRKFRSHHPVRGTMQRTCRHGSLNKYAKLRVAHVPRMPECFPCHRHQRKPLVSDPCMHHGTCVTHVPWCMPG